MDCARHAGAPGAEARWLCTRCDHWHCDGCVRRLKVGREYLEVCPDCGGVCRVGASSVPEPSRDLAELLRRPLSRDGLLTAVAMAVPAWLATLPLISLIGGLLWFIYAGALAGYYFQIVDHVGRGRDGLPGPSDAWDEQVELLNNLFRGLLCLLLGGLPLLLYRIWGTGDGTAVTLSSRPLTVLGLLALGHLYVPAALLAVVISNRTFAAVWPLLWLRIVARAPEAYLRLVGLFLLSLGAWWVGDLTATFFLGGIPLLRPLLVTTVSNLCLIAQAVLVGGFLRRNAEAFGYD